MNERTSLLQTADVQTTLGTETVFNGTLRFSESLRINGRYEGRIESKGVLIVAKGATVEADIKVGTLFVSGTVKGNVEAQQQVEMTATGKVIGNIRTGKLRMADGVVFEGKVEMLRQPDSLDIFSASPSQLKRSLDTV